MTKTIIQTLLFIFLSLSAFSGLVQAETLNVVSPGPGHPMYKIATIVLSEALGKIGHQAEFHDFPPLRSLFMFERSKADCYLFATEMFLKNYPTAIKVQPPLGYDEMMVFSKSAKIKVNGWNSIRAYSIGYMKGMDVVEQRIQGMRTDGAENPRQALDKLRGGRTDLVILPRMIGCTLIANYPGIKMLEPPLEKVALYTYLNAARADIAPQLSEVLSAMQRNGRLQEITEPILHQNLHDCSSGH